eukprot:TRINITY_DN17015_c0_g1_i1.p2 TRINITY_DN17015_c0_g1~~TRINITY_DN17015_c0_g1_i1.p2  ORF type:complete len:121 (+),score=30.38 TRINITY_DN17015_c0_g1_i1:82-444(+)
MNEDSAALRVQCFARRFFAKREVEAAAKRRAANEAEFYTEEERAYLDECARKIQQLFMQKIARKWRRKRGAAADAAVQPRRNYPYDLYKSPSACESCGSSIYSHDGAGGGCTPHGLYTTC